MMHSDEPDYLTDLANTIERKLSSEAERTPEQRASAMAGLTKARVLASGRPIVGDRAAVLQSMTDNFINAGNIDMPSNP